MDIYRKIIDNLLKSNRNILLIGPRQTGKSTLIRALKPELSLNLADESTYLAFARNPRELVERLSAKAYLSVFIDEVQRLPSLLNTLQVIMDDTSKPQPRFYLTGSSARKLRRNGANLLPGRIHTYFLHALTATEIGETFSTQAALETGTLPGIYTDPSRTDQEKTLRSYSATYLKEEIQAEALTRNLEGFSRFLFVAASRAGEFIDFQKLAMASQISRQSAIRFMDVLEDTLIVNRCSPFAKSAGRRLVQRPIYYFFDTGVLNALLGNFIASDDRKGNLFEHLFFNQLIGTAASLDREITVSTFRTAHGAEVDFIVEYGRELFAIELKASRDVGKNDCRGFKSFSDFYAKPHQKLIAYLGDIPKRIDDVLVLPWKEALAAIFGTS